MVDPRASRFWQAALRSGLIEARDLESWWEAIPPHKRPEDLDLDAVDRRLAREAVRVGRLTLWQSQQLVRGRWQGLCIGKYVLLDLIGQGGMGSVYLARDERLRRPVAVKVLSRKRAEDPRSRARFDREVYIGAQLQHENLVRVYDDGEAVGFRFLVMEYIDGRNVGELLTEYGRLPPAAAASVARQVALGLEHLHRKGLLHRDLKPNNILVDRDGTAKVTDLGLAYDENANDALTRDGAALGTLEYTSPEQAKNSRGVDIRSDIYSLGCTLYHMIGGRLPFARPSLPELLLAHQADTAEPLTILAPDCPPELEAVVRRMLAKSPDHRYSRPAEVARALEPFAAGPGWLGRLAAAPPTALGEAAYAAEWLETEPDPASGPRPAASFPTTSDSQDLFPRVEGGPAPPLPFTSGSSAVNPSADPWTPGARLALGLILVLGLIALLTLVASLL